MDREKFACRQRDSINIQSSTFPMTVREHLSTYTVSLPTERSVNSHECPGDTLSNPSDLVSLAWLQKGDIIQLAPLDEEEDQQNGLGSSTASLSSLKSDDCSTFRPTSADCSFPVRTAHPPITSASLSVNSSFNHLRPMEYVPVQCSIESTRLPAVHLAQGSPGLTKPNYSYTHLIFMAIESTPQKCMTVNQIYNWCETNFPFYKNAGAGWKNSLRHNLSINRSFKRLPRDSRGPGRGAFWTVEPRERASLLDAIKRNPWNFNQMASLVSNSDSNCYPSFTLSDFGVSSYGMRRFGLSHSAPGQMLRYEGLGKPEWHVDQMENSIDPNLRVPSGPDEHTGSTYIAQPQVSFEGQSGNPHLYRGPYSTEDGPPQVNGTGVPSDWSTEDEEKYQSTLRLLMESVAPENENGNDLVGAEFRPCSGNQDNQPLPANDCKVVTKQRRKSRLQPTRIGACNECKENAASGCEVCSEKRFHLSDRSVKSSFRERALEDVANALDSDQEHGPAGGPSLKKSQKPHCSTTGTVSVKPEESSSANNVTETDEVYVTPAPFIDHEYAHCQAQLRGLEDNRLVNRYNRNYCSEMIRRLTGSRSHLNRNIDPAFVSRNTGSVSDEYNRPDYESERDIRGFDDLSDTDRGDLVYPNNSADLHRPQHGKRGRRGRGAASTVNKFEKHSGLSRRGRRRFKRTSSRRGRGRRPKSIVRRNEIDSRLTNKLKKRQYSDDGEGDLDSFSDATNSDLESLAGKSKLLSNLGRSPSTKHLASGEFHHRRRGRPSSVWKNRFTGRPLRSDSDYEDDDYSDTSSEDGLEARYLRIACKRQRLEALRQDYFSSKHESVRSNDDFLPHPLSGGVVPQAMGPLWGHSRMRLVNNLTPFGWPNGRNDSPPDEDLLSESDVLEQDIDECDEVTLEEAEPKKDKEQNTIEAAHLLLGMSQIQSFRQQSGYLSLDSSATSASLMGQTPSPSPCSPALQNCEEKSASGSPHVNASMTSSPMPSAV